MPALAFGLKGPKPSLGANKPAQKRKAVFDDAGSDNDDDSSSPQPPPQAGAKKPSRPLKPLQPLKDDTSSSEDNEDRPRPAKSPKLSHPAPSTTYGLQKKVPLPPLDGTPTTKPPAVASSPEKDKYTNLSSLRTARLHDARAAQLDASVYDYDGVYDTFHANANKKTSSTSKDGSDGTSGSGGPRYMTSLLKSTEQRKRDHERAREKAVQRERENEGEEFEGKESFVTGAYKRQQEEVRMQEEEEARKVEREEELRREGVGWWGLGKMMLEREEERMRMVAEAEERLRNEGGGKKEVAGEGAEGGEGQVDEHRKARELNELGAKILMNEEGEVIDKRQLLSAGLNVAPKKPSAAAAAAAKSSDRSADHAARNQNARPAFLGDSRAAQRERQTRMIERQLEQAAAAQAAEAESEERERAEKNKSKIGEAEKMSAKERYLARKREREAEARKKGGG